MCIYRALISAQSAHMIHINLNTVFYTHVEHNPTKTTHTKHHKEKQIFLDTLMSSKNVFKMAEL